MSEIKASLATPATDAALRSRYRKMGHKARMSGVAREACPVDGMLARWWLEGWDGTPLDAIPLA